MTFDVEYTASCVQPRVWLCDDGRFACECSTRASADAAARTLFAAVDTLPRKDATLRWVCAMCEEDFPASAPRFPVPDEPPCRIHGIHHGRPRSAEGYGFSGGVLCGHCHAAWALPGTS
jgi:hypothetical protein